MSESPRIPAAGPGPSTTPASAPAARASGPAFEALLERLNAHAAELDRHKQALSSAAELPAAVDAARASLEDALNLGAELLEAYRAARQSGGSSGS